MGGLDPAKILVILIIALIVLGPERLPGAARQLGGAWRELNKLREKFEEEVRSAVPDLDLPKIPTSPSRAVTGYLTGLVSGLTDTSASSCLRRRQRIRHRVHRGRRAVRGLAAGGGVTWLRGQQQEDSRSAGAHCLGSEHTAGYRQAPSVPSAIRGLAPRRHVCSCSTSRA